MSVKLGIVPFWKQYDREVVLKASKLAEDLGFHSVWVPEAWSYEQFQLLTEIALNTKTIGVATGIANVFSRSPGLLAMSAATLDEISGGRAILGLGTSGKNVVENFHGVPYKKPLTRMRETIRILRTLWRGDRLTPELSTLAELRHFKLEMTPARPDIPIYVASLQRKAINEIGRSADGWVPTFWPYAHYQAGLDWIAKGAREVGRDPSEVELAPFVAVVPIEDLDFARSMMKPMVSFYIGGMGTYYHDMFCRFGFRENADLVRDLYNSGDRKQAAAAVSDELVDAIAICGPAEHCREKLEEWKASGMGLGLVSLPQGAPYEMIRPALEAIAPVL